MLVVPSRNANDALHFVMQRFSEAVVDEENSAGGSFGKSGQPLIERVVVRDKPTLEFTQPVTTVYSHPRERVVFCPVRDANPFFHMMEALWILDGRNDVGWLSQFNGNISSFSDNGWSFHAGYGHRLRHHFQIDQLVEVVQKLKRDRNTRQAVLQIWDAKVDLTAFSRDIPCNDTIFLKLRNDKLNITVCCRSNDAIWGAYGANSVQFSVLQEWVASMIGGVSVGTYSQVSDSLHVYTDLPVCQRLLTRARLISKHKYVYQNPYMISALDTDTLVLFNTDMKVWFEELRYFFDQEGGTATRKNYVNGIFHIAVPMYRAWQAYKLDRDFVQVEKELECMPACDWKTAAGLWMFRRKEKMYD
jgi:hypothetical protein